MKTVICQINSKYIHSSLAAWCLLAGVREYSIGDVDAAVLEGTINEKSEATLARILDASPEAIGFCTYIWNFSRVLKLAKQVKAKLPNAYIILGGPEVSYSSRELLETYPFIDFILSGEGEKSFAALTDALALGSGFESVGGLSYRSVEGIVSNLSSAPLKLPPSPYLPEYFDTLCGRIAYIETSRGCPFSCAFCLSGTCGGGGLRFFPLERSKSEILKLAASGTRTIKFVDRTFNADRKRALELFQFIIDNYGGAIPEGVTFHFEIAARLLDVETLEVISRFPLGAAQFEVGIQSFNEKTLEAIGRREKLDLLEANTVRLISLGNVSVHTDLIAGLPFEDYTSFGRGFDRAFGMKPRMLQLGFLKVLHGSAMGEDGYLYPCEHDSTAPYEVSSTKWLSHEELMMLKRIEDIHERLYNSARFLRTLDFLIKASRRTPFEVYEKLADEMQYDMRISLDDFTHVLYDAARTVEGVDEAGLKEVLMLDRMESNSEGRLPELLRFDLTKAKRILLKRRPELFAGGVRRSIGWSALRGCAVFADYSTSPDPITDRYTAEFVYEDQKQ